MFFLIFTQERSQMTVQVVHYWPVSFPLHQLLDICVKSISFKTWRASFPVTFTICTTHRAMTQIQTQIDLRPNLESGIPDLVDVIEVPWKAIHSKAEQIRHDKRLLARKHETDFEQALKEIDFRNKFEEYCKKCFIQCKTASLSFLFQRPGGISTLSTLFKQDQNSCQNFEILLQKIFGLV